MTYRTIEPGLAKLLALGLEAQLPERVEEWKKQLERGRVTTEMRDVFVAIGWLSSARDSRLGDATGDGDNEQLEIDPGAPAEDVDIREPKTEKDRPRRERHEAAVETLAAVPG